jgi:UDP-N-acetylmuramoyl-L-alanyl-D-glutamate--2,6-diaminopimelate ligase
MEVSSHALAQGRVDAVRYDVAVFTNLTEDHLDFHADLQEYFAAKASLFTSAHSRLAVVDIDAKYGRRIAEAADIPVITVSAAGRADAHWRAADARYDAGGSSFTLLGPGVSVQASVRMPGEFNVSNALLAIAALVAADVPVDTAVRGVAAFPGVPGRMERVDAGQDFLALVDYAHTPDAVARVLAALRVTATGSLIAVLGCGGDRDRVKRAPMGAAGAAGADVCILTSDNPRSEDPAAIVAAMKEGTRSVPEARRGEVLVELDRGAAIAMAVARARPGDTVAVLGKGHETGQEVRAEVRPFDDRIELARAIRSTRTPQGGPGAVP